MKSARSVASAILVAFTLLFLGGVASAKYPVDRQRPQLAAAKDGAARLELPNEGRSNTEVVRVDVDLPTGKVTERIQTNLKSSNVAIIPSEMLDNPTTAMVLASPSSTPPTQPQATLVSEHWIVVHHPHLSGAHYVPFRSTGAQPDAGRLQAALGRLPEHLYVEFGGLDEVVFDGAQFTVVVEGKSIALNLPPITQRPSASHTTYATP